MSNINKINGNEQLFTKLTPEEGATISGGLKVPSSDDTADSNLSSTDDVGALESPADTSANLFSGCVS